MSKANQGGNGCFFRSMLALAIFCIPFFFSCPAGAEGENGFAEVIAGVKEVFPNLEVSAVHATPVSGVYEVVSGMDVIYFAKESRHVFMGDLYDSRGTNLTQRRKEELAADKIKTLPLDIAVKIGSGEKKVIEVTDPDCPFCRKASKYLDTREDITRYVFFLPLTRIHPKAESKVKYILSAKDKAQAYHDVMDGKYDKNPLPEFEPDDLLEKHVKVARELGVRGTPNFWINGKKVAGANLKVIQKLLGDE